MPFCKSCGTPYTKSLGVCPKCNAQEKLREHEIENAQKSGNTDSPSHEKNSVKGFLPLLVYIPALIFFLYAMAYIMKLLR